MTRVRLLPSRSSQSSCVHVPVAYPQLDCKLLEGSHHFRTAVPRQPGGVRFLKTLGAGEDRLEKFKTLLGGKNRVRGMKSCVNLCNHHIFTLT